SVHTFGLGGDSEVAEDGDGSLRIGPRRLVPLSLLVHQNPGLLPVLAAQAADASGPLQGRFVLRQRPLDVLEHLARPQQRLWDSLEQGPVPLSELGSSYAATTAIARLVDRGLVAVSGFTPSDAAHVLGHQRSWSTAAAVLGAEI